MFALVILLAAIAWFGLRLVVAQWLLDDVLTDAAPPGTTAKVTELSASHAVLADVDLPGIGHVNRVAITFSIAGLLDGTVEDVVLERPAFTVVLDADGRPTAPLRELLSASGDRGATTPPPLARIAVEQGSLHLEAPLGWVNLDLQGSYVLRDQDSGHLDFDAVTRLGELHGEANLAGLAAGTGARVQVVLSSSRLGVAGASVEDVTGHADLALGETIGLVLSLQSEASELDGHALGPLALSGTWRGSAGAIDADVGNGDSAATAHLSATYYGTGPAPAWTLAGLLSAARDLELPLPSPLAVTAPTRIELDFSGSVPAQPDMSDLSGGGSLSITSAGVASEMLVAGAVDLSLDIALEDRALTMQLGGPATVSGITAGNVPPDWLAALPARTYDLAMAADGLRITLQQQASGYAVDADFGLVLSADDGFDLSASGDIDLVANADGTPTTGGLRRADVSLRGPLFDGVEAEGIDLSGSALVTPVGLQAAIDAGGRFSHVALGGVTASGLSFTLPLRLTQKSDIRFDATIEPTAVIGIESLAAGGVHAGDLLAELPLAIAHEDGTTTVTLTGPGWLDIGALEHHSLRTVGTTSLKLEADTLPLFTLRQTVAGTGWDGRIVLAGTAVEAEAMDDDGAVAATIAGTLPSLRVSASRLGTGHLQATAESHGGDLAITVADVAISDLELLASYNDGLSPWPQIQATGIDMRDLRDPARFVPARLDLSFKPVWPEGKDARLSLDIHMAGVRYLANIESSWEPARERLSAYVRVPPIRFSPELQPDAISPLYGPLLSDATGAVEVVGALGLVAGDPFADLDIILYDLSGTLAGAEVKNLAGSVHLSDLAPLRTPPDQQITAAALDPGLPMENLALTFSLPGNGAAWLSGASLELAGGTVSAEPTTFDPARAENRIILDVAGVELSRLAALLEMPEVEATGRLAGSIPVLFADGDIAIEGGRLATEEPGVLRYLPESGAAIAGGDEYMELVVNALANFQYESLAIDLDRALGGASVVGLHINGANPDVYDGYPIELNVNLTGDLDRIARDSMAGWRIPDEIRKRLSGF